MLPCCCSNACACCYRSTQTNKINFIEIFRSDTRSPVEIYIYFVHSNSVSRWALARVCVCVCKFRVFLFSRFCWFSAVKKTVVAICTYTRHALYSACVRAFQFRRKIFRYMQNTRQNRISNKSTVSFGVNERDSIYSNKKRRNIYTKLPSAIFLRVPFPCVCYLSPF